MGNKYLEPADFVLVRRPAVTAAGLAVEGVQLAAVLPDARQTGALAVCVLLHLHHSTHLVTPPSHQAAPGQHHRHLQHMVI